MEYTAAVEVIPAETDVSLVGSVIYFVVSGATLVDLVRCSVVGGVYFAEPAVYSAEASSVVFETLPDLVVIHVGPVAKEVESEALPVGQRVPLADPMLDRRFATVARLVDFESSFVE